MFWYVCTVTGGMLPRAGNSKTMCARSGHSHWFLPSTYTHSTLVGLALSSCSAR